MQKKLPVILSSIVLILAILIKVADFSLVEQFQYKVFDSFQETLPRKYIEQPVRIIDIDDESLARIGQWPWSRDVMAKIIDKLNDAGVSAIAMDIVFAEKDRTSPANFAERLKNNQEVYNILKKMPDYDDLFQKTIGQSNVVTGFVLTQDKNNLVPDIKPGFSWAGSDPKPFIPEFKGSVVSLNEFEKSASGNGALNSVPDKDGILRRVPMVFNIDNKLVPSLSAEALRVAQNAGSYIIKTSDASGEGDFGQLSGITAIKIGQFEVPTDANGKLWVYYSKPQKSRYIPVWRLLDDSFDASILEGNIIFIGTSAAGLRDIRATPLDPTASGVEIHAQAIEQILSGEYLYRPDWIEGAEITLMVIVGIIVIVLINILSAIWGALFTAITLSVAIGFSWYMFKENGLLIDPVTPGIAIVLIYISESLVRYMGTESEKKHIRNAFSHYMSPALVEQLAKDPNKLKLGGETKNITMLFCDIRGFTTISEQFNAHELTKFINRFLTPMTEIILNNQGTIDKYMGDCIMAFWNAPLDVPNHPSMACRAALSMIDGLDKLNERQEAEARIGNRDFIPINIGIGLNTGDCSVGNMGSDQRFDYSVLGDDVNLASRLEGQSKTYGVNIVVGEKTKEGAKGFAFLELDLIKVKGKTKPVKIFALLGDEKLATDKKFEELCERFSEVLSLYREQKWHEAINLITICRNLSHQGKLHIGGLFSLYEERIEQYLLNPPRDKWDGVFEATSK